MELLTKLFEGGVEIKGAAVLEGELELETGAVIAGDAPVAYGLHNGNPRVCAKEGRYDPAVV